MSRTHLDPCDGGRIVQVLYFELYFHLNICIVEQLDVLHGIWSFSSVVDMISCKFVHK